MSGEATTRRRRKSETSFDAHPSDPVHREEKPEKAQVHARCNCIGHVEQHTIVINTGSAVCFLESYRGRDQAIRLLHYALLLAAGICTDDARANAFETVSTALGNARVVLRLFDDLAMLKYTLAFGWGPKEKDSVTRLLGLADNIACQLFYPLEHVAFLADSRVLAVDAQFWWTAALLAWGLSLFVCIIRSAAALLQARRVRTNAAKTTAFESMAAESKTWRTTLQAVMNKVKQAALDSSRREALLETASIVKHSADLVNVVHWLPAGCTPWSGGGMSRASVGALGTLSSAIGIAQAAAGEPVCPGES